MGKKGRSGAPLKYAWPDLGRCRVMDPDNYDRLRSAACMYGKLHGMKFECRSTWGFIVVKRVA